MDTNPRPDLVRADSRLVLVSHWYVGTPELQREAADAALGAWRKTSRPDGLLAHTVLSSNDGTEVVNYSQWTGRDAVAAFRRNDPPERVQGILDAVPEIERRRLDEYELYRSGFDEGDTREPGCVVLVEVDFEGPGPRRQRDWTDAVFEALEADPKRHSGGISAHFHASTDGTRVLNLAEWESEQAHVDALAAPGEGIGTGSPEWTRVQRYPGLRHSRVTRYRYYGTA